MNPVELTPKEKARLLIEVFQKGIDRGDQFFDVQGKKLDTLVKIMDALLADGKIEIKTVDEE